MMMNLEDCQQVEEKERIGLTTTSFLKKTTNAT
jgi:hypothetical protein